MKLFGKVIHIGKQNRLGTQAIVTASEEVPVRTEVGTVSEELRAKFIAYQEQKSGIEASLDHFAKELGKLRIAETELWPEVYKELGIEDGPNSALSINRTTGVVTAISGIDTEEEG